MTNHFSPAQLQPTERSLAQSRVLPRWSIAIMLALCVVKFVLISHDEIGLHAADDNGNAIVASAWYWGNAYGNYTHVRQPAYPLFVSLSTFFGVPMRLWMELAWLFSAAIFVTALRRVGTAAFTCTVSFALLAFMPSNFSLFCRLLPDSLYAASLLVFIGSLLAAMLTRLHPHAWRWGLLAGLAGAINANTRPEAFLLTGLLAVALTLCLWHTFHQPREPASVPSRLSRLTSRPLLFRAAVVGLLPWLIITGTTYTLTGINRATIGLDATYDLNAPGFKGLYQALLEIPPDSPALLLPIPRDVRDKAYAASPTFAQLKPYLDGDQPVTDYLSASERLTGVKGEYGGWSIWALRRAAWLMNQYRWKDAAEYDAFFAKAASELQAAARARTLPHRRVMHPYLPPEYGLLAKQLPASLMNLWRVAVSVDPVQPTEQLAPWYVDRFNAAALRRIPLVGLQSPPNSTLDEPANLWHRAANRSRIAAVQHTIITAGPALTRVGGALLLICTIPALCVLFRARRTIADPLFGLSVLVLLALAFIVARTLVVALLDANAVPAQHRYILPAVILASALIPVFIEVLVRIIDSWRKPSKRIA